MAKKLAKMAKNCHKYQILSLILPNIYAELSSDSYYVFLPKAAQNIQKVAKKAKILPNMDS